MKGIVQTQKKKVRVVRGIRSENTNEQWDFMMLLHDWAYKYAASRRAPVNLQSLGSQTNPLIQPDFRSDTDLPAPAPAPAQPQICREHSISRWFEYCL